MGRVRNKEHWFGDHPPSIRRESPYPVFVQGMAQLAADLAGERIEVLNASMESTLPYWTKITTAQLEQVCAAPT